MNGVIDNGARKISTPVENSPSELNRDSLAIKYKNTTQNGQKHMTSDEFVNHFNKNRSNSNTGSIRTDNINTQRQETTCVRTQDVRRNTGAMRTDNINNTRQEATSQRRTPQNPIYTRNSQTQVIDSNVYIPKNIKNNAQYRAEARSSAIPSGTVRDTSSTIRVQSIQDMQKTNYRDNADFEQEKKQSRLKQFLKSLGKKWNTPEYREHQDTSKTRVLPLTIVMAVFTIAVSLMLIVGSSVLLNTASNQVSQLEYEVSQLEKESNELQSKLELKNELAGLDQLAQEYGMIDKNYASVKYIKIENVDKITNYEEEDQGNINLASLLSAFGFKLK